MRVGEYVRTKDGIIAKIIKKEKNPYGEETIFVLDKEINIYDLEMGDMYLALNPIAEETTNKIDIHFGDEKIIKKHSSDIIDLIEVGDIITFKEDDDVYKVICIPDKKVGLDIFYLAKNYDGETEDISISKKQMEIYIKSIVTKEKFEEMEYKL